MKNEKKILHSSLLIIYIKGDFTNLIKGFPFPSP